jgi:hypothetical protein
VGEKKEEAQEELQQAVVQKVAADAGVKGLDG